MNMEWNDKGLQQIYEALSPAQQAKFHKSALSASLKKLARLAKADATTAGYAAQGPAEKNGWEWVRYGRVAASIIAGKVWSRKTRVTGRVFNTGGKRQPFMKRAPHAHLAILGHRKFLPTGVKGQSVPAGRTPGVPFYGNAFNKADEVFRRELEASVGKMIKRLNKQGKL